MSKRTKNEGLAPMNTPPRSKSPLNNSTTANNNNNANNQAATVLSPSKIAQKIALPAITRSINTKIEELDAILSGGSSSDSDNDKQQMRKERRTTLTARKHSRFRVTEADDIPVDVKPFHIKLASTSKRIPKSLQDFSEHQNALMRSHWEAISDTEDVQTTRAEKPNTLTTTTPSPAPNLTDTGNFTGILNEISDMIENVKGGGGR